MVKRHDVNLCATLVEIALGLSIVMTYSVVPQMSKP